MEAIFHICFLLSVIPFQKIQALYICFHGWDFRLALISEPFYAKVLKFRRDSSDYSRKHWFMPLYERYNGIDY